MFIPLKFSFPLKKVIFPVLSACFFTLNLSPLNAQVLPTKASIRIQSLAEKKLLSTSSPFQTLPFRNIGPSIMSGRVVDIDVNPKNPTEFYVAYATGGLWYTQNNGQSFVPVMDSLNVLFIGDIAVNWTSGTIWVGTGEVNSSRSSYAGTGIYKSNDKGKNWTYLGLPESHHIGKILIDPTDENTVWVAVLGHLYSSNKERGVYKTTNGGKTWEKSLFIDDNTGCVDLDLNPANPKTVYAAMWHRERRAWNFTESGKTSGIYKTDNGGKTWELISSAKDGFMQGDKIGRIGVAVFPKNPDIIYAVVDNNTPTAKKKNDADSLYQKEDFKTMDTATFANLHTNLIDSFLRKNSFPKKYTGKNVKEMVASGKIRPIALWDYLDANDGFQNNGIPGCEVYRSNDAGKTWHKTHDKPIRIYSTYGYYFGKIYTSAYNPDKIFIQGIATKMSTDGGKTFKTIDKGNVHGDHHALWINPNNDAHILDGNDGGCNLSYDNGEHWFLANTPAVGQFYAIDVDNAMPYNVYGGLQDNGSWWGPSTNKENINWTSDGDYPFHSLNGGDGMQVQVDTTDNETVYSGFQFGIYFKYNRNKNKAGKIIHPIHELGEKPLRYNWQSPILLSKFNQNELFLGSNRLYRSMQQGDKMQAISGDLSNGPKLGNVPFGTITTICESPLRNGLLYVGTDDGNVQVSFDNGFSWTKINQPGYSSLNTQQLWVSRITASQFKMERVYLSLNGYRNDNFAPYLYRSDDNGKTWQQIGSNLPEEPINVVKEDLTDENIIYVGTDGGLYVSFDKGNHFMIWDAGLPVSVPIHDIALQREYNEIVLGTHGRSLYVNKLEDVQKLRTDPDWLTKKQKEEKAKDDEDNKEE
ncbi:MAG: hypothetical protein KDB92_10105 [Chitinophagaceae bacterium]|nr:hypothetical protein [Chitinophagaceae bacterium]MCB0741373.1 hypothetical protein [Chitinophagaceae bacterium]